MAESSAIVPRCPHCGEVALDLITPQNSLVWHCGVCGKNFEMPRRAHVEVVPIVTDGGLSR